MAASSSEVVLLSSCFNFDGVLIGDNCKVLRINDKEFTNGMIAEIREKFKSKSWLFFYEFMKCFHPSPWLGDPYIFLHSLDTFRLKILSFGKDYRKIQKRNKSDLEDFLIKIFNYQIIRRESPRKRNLQNQLSQGKKQKDEAENLEMEYEAEINTLEQEMRRNLQEVEDAEENLSKAKAEASQLKKRWQAYKVQNLVCPKK